MNATPTPIIIGLTGYAGTGKDTVRTILEGMGYHGFAFADPIRSMLRELFLMHDISASYMDERRFKEATIPGLGVSYRHLAQTLGTEWGRRCLADDIWVKLAALHMARIMEDNGATPGLRFVVSDVRFVNEARWIKEMGGEIWRVVRDGAAPVRAHVSESELYDFTADHTIDNNGTIAALHAQISAALQPTKTISPSQSQEVAIAGAVMQFACHKAASDAGWWTDKDETDIRGNPYCFSNKLALVHSEISEAMEGDRKSLMDTHLPHRPMREVELADAAIRIFDLAGAYGMDLGGAIAEKMAYNAQRADHKPAARAGAGGKAY